MKKNKFILLMLITLLTLLVGVDKVEATYSTDYATWTNRGTEYQNTPMVKSGCYVVSQSQLLAHIGVGNVENGFNPDRYAEWEVATGHLPSNALTSKATSFGMIDAVNAPIEYAKSVGYKLTLKANRKPTTEEKVLADIKAGYNIILNLNTHFVFVDNEATANADYKSIYVFDIGKRKVKLSDIISRYDYSYTSSSTGKTVTVKGSLVASFAYSKPTKIDTTLIDLSNYTVSGISNKTYTGSAIKQSITVKNGSKTLLNGTDYKITYSKNTNVGTATITITGINKYTGTITKTFKINPKSIEKLTVSGIKTKNYTGKELKQSIVVKDGSKILVAGTDYTVSYSNNTNPGTAKITITGKGNYKNNITKSFDIKVETVSNFKAKVIAKSKIKLTWKKNTKVSGYEISYKTSKNGKYKILKSNVKNNTDYYKTTKFSTKKGKKYYFRIRSYQIINGKKYYSEYKTYTLGC